MFRERKVVQQVHVDWVTFLLEGDFSIKDTIIYIVESCLETNVWCYICLIVTVELDGFRRVSCGPERQRRHVRSNSDPSIPSKCRADD